MMNTAGTVCRQQPLRNFLTCACRRPGSYWCERGDCVVVIGIPDTLRYTYRISRGGDKLLKGKTFIPGLRVLIDWKTPSISFTPVFDNTAAEFHSNAQKATRSTVLNATTVATSQKECI